MGAMFFMEWLFVFEKQFPFLIARLPTSPHMKINEFNRKTTEMDSIYAEEGW